MLGEQQAGIWHCRGFRGISCLFGQQYLCCAWNFFFGILTRHLCACTVHVHVFLGGGFFALFFFISSEEALVALVWHAILTRFHLGKPQKSRGKKTKKHFKIECCRHISICWPIHNCCEWKEGGERQRMREGWWSQKKIGIDCWAWINWTPPLPPPCLHPKRCKIYLLGLSYRVMSVLGLHTCS